jgi:ParB-like chromosome segregation protein Spo0J
LDPQNARSHPDGQIDLLVQSIAEFGWTRPLLVDETDTVLIGNGALLAARRHGLKEVSVIVLGHLSEIQKRAYAIAVSLP